MFRLAPVEIEVGRSAARKRFLYTGPWSSTMTKLRWILATLLTLTAAALLVAQNSKVDTSKLMTGRAAFADAAKLVPGNFHKITPADLPKPFDTESARSFGTVVARPA